VEIATAEQMKVQVPNGLARAATIIHHHPIAWRQIALRRELRGHEQRAPQKRTVLFHGVAELLEMLARADQDVRGRLRRDIFKGEELGVFVDELRRHFMFADLAKDAVGHLGHLCKPGAPPRGRTPPEYR
jgi:hypothetical protein